MLGDFVTHKKGFAFKSSSFSEQGVPVVKVTNFTDSSVDLSGIVCVSESIAKENRAFKLNAGDIVVQTVGSWPNNPASVVGKVVKIPNELDQSLLNQNAVILRPLNELDKDFLFFLLKDQNFKNYIINTAQGAANQASITLDSIFRFQFFKPILNIQHKIAAILTAYDDLIETNKHRITLLEKMAEELYREWFVRMRFPGYQNTKFVKGVPEGWKETTLGKIAFFTMGQSPKSEFYNEHGDGLPFHQGVGTYGDRFPRKVTFCTVDGRRAHAGDILFSVRAPVGRLNIADCEMIIGRGLSAIRHRKGHNSYLYYLLKTVFSNEDIIGNGSIFNSVGKDELYRFGLHHHPDFLVDKFDKIVSPIDQQIEALIHSVSVLTQTRDLLLPRLISGKLSVEDLDIQLPPSMREEAD